MDICVISPTNGCYQLSSDEDIDPESDETSELGELKSFYNDIIEAEKDRRTEVLNSSDYTFEVSHEDPENGEQG